MKLRWLLAAGLLAFLAGVVILFPARIAYRWFIPTEVTLAGIEGSIWNGRADHSSIHGVYVRNLDWTIHPLLLLTGRVSGSGTGELVSGFIEGRFTLTAGGRILLQDISASLALSALSGALEMPRLDGTANLRFNRVDIRDGLPVAANGTLEVANLLAPTIYPRAAIGGYRAEFFTQENGIAASVEDTDGVVDVAGSLTVSRDRNFVFLATIAPKPGADEGLRNQMRMLGSPDARGYYEMRIEGML